MNQISITLFIKSQAIYSRFLLFTPVLYPSAGKVIIENENEKRLIKLE